MNDIYENTICYKIDQLEKAIEEVIQGGGLDVTQALNNLKTAKKSAQNMENALKARKKIMEKHGIEDEYQKEKKKQNTPQGVNKVKGKTFHHKRKIRFRVTVEEMGKLVYQNETFGAVVCCVEDIKDMNNFGVIDGKVQTFFAGHPLTVFFAFDQLRQAYQEKKIEILTTIKKAVLGNKFADPRVRKQIIDAMGE